MTRRAGATNKLKGGHPLGNALMDGTYRRLTKETKGGWLWAGHHALEWCSQGDRRMLDGTHRPCDDWAPPTNPAYLRWRAKVEERYGPDFGNPPPDPRMLSQRP